MPDSDKSESRMSWAELLAYVRQHGKMPPPERRPRPHFTLGGDAR